MSKVQAFSLGQVANVMVTDQWSNPLDMYTAGGINYVRATHGQVYKVVVSNQYGNRIAAVTAVDNIDVMSGRTSDFTKDTGLIAEPWGSTTFDGWRVNDRQTDQFKFSVVERDTVVVQLTGNRHHQGLIELGLFQDYVRPVYRDRFGSLGGLTRGGGMAKGFGEATSGSVGTAAGDRQQSLVHADYSFRRSTLSPIATVMIFPKSGWYLHQHGIDMAQNLADDLPPSVNQTPSPFNNIRHV